MSYIGNTAQNQAFTPAVDYFSGNGSTVAFTLSRPVASVAQVEAVIENVVQNPSSAYTVSGNTITFTSAPPSGTNNIYIRYTSPITQVIQPGQGTVGSSQIIDAAVTANKLASGVALANIGSGGVTSDYLASAAQPYGFKNRIINGAMVVNQRNTTITDYGYATDRWSYNPTAASKASIAQSSTAPAGFINSLLVTSSAATTVGSTDVYIIEQKIEGLNITDLAWGTANAATVTLSFWVRSSLTGTFSGAVCNAGPDRSYPFTFTINSANTFEQKTVTIAGDTTGTWATNNGAGIRVCFSLGCGSSRSATASAWTGSSNIFAATGATNLIATNGATFYITGVQLEKGSAATSFDYRPYGTELALCQRYYAKMLGNSYSAFAAGECGSSTVTSSYIKYPVPMRTPPTMSSNGSIQVYSASTTYNITGVQATYGTYDSALLQLVCGGGGMTAGRGALIMCNADPTAYFAFSAEL